MSYEFMYLVNILPFFISREGYKRYSMNLTLFFAKLDVQLQYMSLTHFFWKRYRTTHFFRSLANYLDAPNLTSKLKQIAWLIDYFCES